MPSADYFSTQQLLNNDFEFPLEPPTEYAKLQLKNVNISHSSHRLAANI
jgi:hypothetical protein